jgi:ABC-type phosphate transport system substrate-binding protein
MRARWPVFGVLTLLAWLAAPLGAEEIVVIVHPERAAALSIDQLAQIYLKQRRYWPGGEGIQPVNRESESREREAFADVVFSDTPQQLTVYWNRQYFLGVLPPATLASDQAVKAYVARDKRAIGYIRASAVDASVRVALTLPEHATTRAQPERP